MDRHRAIPPIAGAPPPATVRASPPGPGLLASLAPGETLLGHAVTLMGVLFGEEADEILGDLGVQIDPCVLDANAILRDISYAARSGRRTALQEAARLGGVRFYASTAVRDEVTEKLREEGEFADYARRAGLDRGEAMRLWREDYAPWITFLDPSELPWSPAVGALALRDRDDVPTAQLVEFLHPDTVLSSDKDLEGFGALAGELSVVTLAYRDGSRRDIARTGVAVGGSVTVSVAYAALRPLLALSRRVWPALAPIVVVAGIGAVLHPASRRYLAGRASRVSLSGVARAAGVVWELVRAYGELEAQAGRSRLRLAAAAAGATRGLPPPSRALGYLVLVLATAPAPLSPAQISRRMVAAGYEPRGMRPDLYVAALLRGHPRLFEKTWGHRWQLRSHGLED